ncbi:hypothetical protein [Candidatus Nitrotoga arctica]|uniref:hypothetical protein n=1 Tax=Candidatus Nitrotoga arctica TaxID=453162 RepID=UPI001EFBDBAA|nr:hypothetical protein [Candidatus Nitrotoga arctica]
MLTFVKIRSSQSACPHRRKSFSAERRAVKAGLLIKNPPPTIRLSTRTLTVRLERPPFYAPPANGQVSYCSDSALDGVFYLFKTLILFNLFFLTEQYLDLTLLLLEHYSLRRPERTDRPNLD